MDPLEKVALGRTGLHVTRMGLGGSALGGMYGDIPDEQAYAVVHQALDLGINFFDTAPLYGRGKSEWRLGKALAGVPRDRYVLATKVGRLLVPVDYDETGGRAGGRLWSGKPVFDFSYDGVLRSLEESLERLGMDRIDVVHIHDPWRHYEQAIQEAYPTLRKLREEGVIRGVSVGIGSLELLMRFAIEGEFDCFLLSNLYNLLDQPALEELLPLCAEKGIGVVAGGTYSSGILATGATEGAKYGYRDAPEDVLRRVEALEAVASRYGVRLRAAASQFVLAHPAVTTIIPSTRRPERVVENFELLQEDIPAEFWAELEEKKLIPEHAPVPSEM
jgi:D-threo-aldose 1-dehydrogenase